MNYRLVIFDLDGTLIDSEDFIVWSFMEASRITGISVDIDVLRESIGLPLDEIISRIIKSNVVESEIKWFIEVRRGIIRENWRRMVKLFPDVEPTLRVLRDMGLILAVASSSIEERIREFLDYLGVLGFFQAISGVKPGVRGKPEPDTILRVLEETGVLAGHAVYIGDREVDCIAAMKASVDFILLERKPLKLRECKPMLVVKTLNDIPVVLKAIKN